MKRPLFVDTSGWCAVYDQRDDQHALVEPYWNSLAQTTGLLYTTDYVLNETITLVKRRVDHATAVRFGQSVQASRVVRVIPVTAERWQRAWKIFLRYEEQGLSFTDCTSFTVMQEFKLREALALDQHFVQMGFALVP